MRKQQDHRHGVYFILRSCDGKQFHLSHFIVIIFLNRTLKEPSSLKRQTRVKMKRRLTYLK